jgi:quercetin dioxygenase-like cupin family protein
MIPPNPSATAGSREVLRTTRHRDADGTEVEEVEWRAGPGWSALPLHRHAGTDERYEILDGCVRVLVDGGGRVYRAGESAIVGADQWHTLEPVDGDGVRICVQRWSTPPPTTHHHDPERTRPMSSFTLDPTTADNRLDQLLVRPGDDDWDTARAAWNLAVDQRPVAVALPETAADVVALVDHARAHGLRIAPQGTGHNAGAIASLDRTLLVKTTKLREVVVDPVARTARVGAGVLWEEVVDAVHPHGLAALSGSSPDVGVVGYTLGGGLSWLARSYGLSCNNVRSIELVTADGRLVRTSADEEPELFWALRGGGGSFGIVTAMEIELFPITEVYAGAMMWPLERASEILHTWRELTAGFPEAMTSVGRVLNLPPIPDIPEPLRGRSFALVEVIFLGDAEEGARLIEPLRALQPEIDTVAVVPPAALVRLHMDPEQPVPGFGDVRLLRELPAEAVDAVVEVAGPGTGSPLLSLEVRHIGGAAGRAPEGHGALPGLAGEFMVFGVGMPVTPELGVAIRASLDDMGEKLAPWVADTTYLNLVEQPADAASFYAADTYARLREAKRRYDPADLFLSNHPIPPSGA